MPKEKVLSGPAKEFLWTNGLNVDTVEESHMPALNNMGVFVAETFACSLQCFSYTSCSADIIKHHIKTVHRGDKTAKCNPVCRFCDQTFCDTTVLKTHIIERHLHIIFYCKFCGESNRRQRKITKHEQLCPSRIIQIPAAQSSSDQTLPGGDLDDDWPEKSSSVESDSGINESESAEPHDDSDADATLSDEGSVEDAAVSLQLFKSLAPYWDVKDKELRKRIVTHHLKVVDDAYASYKQDK